MYNANYAQETTIKQSLPPKKEFGLFLKYLNNWQVFMQQSTEQNIEQILQLFPIRIKLVHLWELHWGL